MMDLVLKIGISDVDPRKPRPEDESFLTSLKEEAQVVASGKVTVIKTVAIQKSAWPEVAKKTFEALSYLEIPVLISSVALLISTLSPIIVQYLKNKSSKEVTIATDGVKVVLKGGASEREVMEGLKAIEKAKGNTSKIIVD